jgi:hypothetical protein
LSDFDTEEDDEDDSENVDVVDEEDLVAELREFLDGFGREGQE